MSDTIQYLYVVVFNNTITSLIYNNNTRMMGLIYTSVSRALYIPCSHAILIANKAVADNGEHTCQVVLICSFHDMRRTVIEKAFSDKE